MTLSATPPRSPSLNDESTQVPPRPLADATAGDSRADTVLLRAGALTAALSTLAPAWMLGSLFAGTGPTAITLGLGLGGVVLAWVASRGRGTAWAQGLAPLVAIGVALVAASTRAPGDLWNAVTDVVFSGQLSTPPVVFGPGWQAVTAVIMLTLGPAALYAALAARNVRVAALVPLPVVVALAIIAPPGRTLTSTLPALLLLVCALAAAQRGERARESAEPLPFGVGDLLRLALGLALVAALIVGASLTGLLGPAALEEAHEAPRAPTTSSLSPDARLFTIRSPRPVPLRLGTLDSYDGSRWLTPDLDPRSLPRIGTGRIGSPGADASQVSSIAVTVDATQGRILPLAPGAFSVQGLPPETQVLPSASAVRLPVAAESGTAYTIRVSLPLATALAKTTYAAPDATPPSPPAAVAELLRAQPSTATPWARLQAFRTALFTKARQSGQGEPVAVTPARVQEMLSGTPATGYELAAADALLARWAGIESRVSYGYLKSQPDADGSYAITAADGASWVEIRTATGAWLPLTTRPDGTTPPPEAAIIRDIPNGQRFGQLFVPMQRAEEQAITAIARYWVIVYVGLAAVLAMLWLLIPGALRIARARRRHRWAQANGPRARIAVAYASVRDTAIDLNVGSPTMTPLEFLGSVEPDEDHEQLAWLVERGLWGDLQRDLTDDDARDAERLARSLRVRLINGQPFTQRVVGFASHTSLRESWQPDLPSAYPASWRAVSLRSLARMPKPWRIALAMVSAVVLVLIPVAVGVDRPDLRPTADQPLPTMPATVAGATLTRVDAIDGAFTARREASLLAATAMYTVTIEGVPSGTLQTGVVKSGLGNAGLTVRSGLLTELGMTEVSRLGRFVLYGQTLGSLRRTFWMDDRGNFQLLTTTDAVKKPRQLLANIVASTQGVTDVGDLVEPPEPVDARRGIDVEPTDPPVPPAPDSGSPQGASR